MNKLYRFFILLTITAVTTGQFSAAMAQGYSGVFADDAEATKQSKEPPAGYAGVISGAVPKAPATPVAQQPQQSQNPAAAAAAAITNSGQLEEKVRMEAASKAARESMKPVQEDWTNLGKEKRVGGLLPVAISIKTMVDSYMKMIADPQLTAEKKSANGKLVYNQLVSLNEGLQVKKSIPDEVYSDMGLPKDYVTDLKEGNQQALTIVQKALDSVRQYK